MTADEWNKLVAIAGIDASILQFNDLENLTYFYTPIAKD